MLGQKIINLARHLIDRPAVSRVLEGVDLHSDNRLRERGILAQAFEFKKINEVPGDYFEFGLWRGKTFTYAHRLARRYHCNGMKLWGFDSFSGLPQIDDARDSVWSTGQFACSEGEFRQILRRAGVAEKDYELVPGYYEQSLNDALHVRLAGSHAAIAYIDCDLYVSTLQALNFLKRYLVNGSIVCFDDFYCYKGNPDQGEQKALREFLVNNSDIIFMQWFDYAPLGKAFIVRIPESGAS